MNSPTVQLTCMHMVALAHYYWVSTKPHTSVRNHFTGNQRSLVWPVPKTCSILAPTHLFCTLLELTSALQLSPAFTSLTWLSPWICPHLRLSMQLVSEPTSVLTRLKHGNTLCIKGNSACLITLMILYSKAYGPSALCHHSTESRFC